MRFRLLAAATVLAAAFAPAADATHYPRECGGTIDVTCREFSCRAVDCFWYDCELYVNPHLGGFTICVI